MPRFGKCARWRKRIQPGRHLIGVELVIRDRGTQERLTALPGAREVSAVTTLPLDGTLINLRWSR